MTLLPTVFNTSVFLPTGELDENRAIDCIADLIPKLRPRLEKEYSWELLHTELQKALREGELPLTTYAIQAANAGDEIADAALRIVFAEMAAVFGKLPGQGPGWIQIWAYGQIAVLRPPHKRPQGRRWHDNWVGNIQICHLIYFVHRVFNVPASRNPEPAARDAKRAPSAISIVVDTLARNGIDLDEGNVQRNIWFGPPGKLVRAIVGEAQDRRLDHLRRQFLNGVSHSPLARKDFAVSTT